jgi:ABC-type multidrug transport system fused ATPase/permease subunit
MNTTPINAAKYSERSIDTFLIVAHRNHIDLSGIADKKANMVLAICAIMISAVLTGSALVFRKDFDNYLFVPTAIFIVCILTVMILSIYTTMPKLSAGTFHKEALKDNNTNLAFFGNFHKMELEDYQWAVEYMQKDTHDIYKMLTTDLYFLGGVLNKKFRLLNITYTLLIIGFIISIISYIVAFYFHYSSMQ